MKSYGKTRSTDAPLKVEVTASKVFVASNIEEVTVEDEQGTRIEFQYDLTEYEKDEYIRMMSDKNDEIEQQVTDTQLALCDVYEMLG